MNKIIVITKILLILILVNVCIADIKIKYKIGNEIITNLDIEYEQRYLVFLRPELEKLTKQELLKISENSLIREIIKKKELKRIYKNIEDINIDQQILGNILNFKKIKSEEELKILLKQSSIRYSDIIKKMKYEKLWNEVITRKYSPLIKIDKNKMRAELKVKLLNTKKFEYNISEILFELGKNQKLNNKYKEIQEYINTNNFKTAASNFSIANSAIRGGEIGWIKETLLSDNLIKDLNKMKINEITKPFKYPNGYLILKLNGKREMKQVVDVDKELNELVKFERNRQLNQFSLLYYKKLKQNTVINEQ